MTLHLKFYNMDMKTRERTQAKTELYVDDKLILIYEYHKLERLLPEERRKIVKEAIELIKPYIGTLIHFYFNDEFERTDELLSVDYVDKKLPKELVINFAIDTPQSYVGRIEPSAAMNEYLKRHNISLAEFRSENTQRGFWRPYHDKFGNSLSMDENKLNYKLEDELNRHVNKYLSKEQFNQLFKIRDLYVTGKMNKSVRLFNAFKKETEEIRYNLWGMNAIGGRVKIVENGRPIRIKMEFVPHPLLVRC